MEDNPTPGTGAYDSLPLAAMKSPRTIVKHSPVNLKENAVNTRRSSTVDSYVTGAQALILLMFVSASGLEAQEPHDARADLSPRVIPRESGEKRIFGDDRAMLLKVGPENSGSGYLFMGYEDLPPGTAIPRHRHEIDEEILIVQRGRMSFEFEADTVIAEAGDAIFLPTGNWISARNVGETVASIFFIFPRAGVEQCFQLFGHGEGEIPRHDTAEELAEEHRRCRMTYGS